MFEKIKGKLARYDDIAALNISQISRIRSLSYIGPPSTAYVVIRTVSDETFWTTETYTALMDRIQAIRNTQGPNGLIEITTAKPLEIKSWQHENKEQTHPA